MGLSIRIILLGITSIVFNISLPAQNFTLSFTPTVVSSPIFVQATDINGDGKPDLLVLSGVTNLLTVLTNDGHGGFGASATIQAGQAGLFANAFAVADVNGDNKPDLTFAVTTGYPNYTTSALFVLTNNGSGGFSGGNYFLCDTNPGAVTVADVNGDGKPDLISANVGGLFGLSHTISVLTNNGAGGFGSYATINVGNHPSTLVTADLNGDGKIDLVTANMNDSTLSILTNSGSGFKVAATPHAGNSPICVTVADVNHDGKPDLITANSGDNTLTVLTNNGHGGFTIASSPPAGAIPYWVTAADVNGDGWADMICIDALSNSMAILTNDGRGNFTIANSLATGFQPFSSTAADVNGDGRLDLVSANSGTNTISIYTNAMTFLPQVSVKKTGGGMVVAWPSQWSGWAGWTLQQSTNISPAGWTAFTGAMGNDGTTETATNVLSGGKAFFRLTHP